MPDTIQQFQPGEHQRKRGARDEQRQQQQGRAEGLEHAYQTGRQGLTTDPATALRRPVGRSADVQRAESGQAGQQDDPGRDTDSARDRRFDLVSALEHADAQQQHRPGQQEGDVAEQRKQHVRDPGPDAAREIAHRLTRSGGRPARVVRAETDQGHQQKQGDADTGQHRRLARQTLQPTRAGHVVGGVGFASEHQGWPGKCRGIITAGADLVRKSDALNREAKPPYRFRVKDYRSTGVRRR